MTKHFTAKIATWVLIAMIMTLPVRALAGMNLVHGPMGAEAAAPSAVDMAGDVHAMHCHEGDRGQPDAPAQPDGHAHAGCAVCADCCIGAVSPPVPFRFAFLDKPRSAPIPLIEQTYAGFQPDGPERPPRSAAR